MNCDEAAEFVSSLCDGGTIPRAMAEHIASCPLCQARLHEYIELGMELRQAASLEVPTEAKDRVWSSPSRGVRFWWRKGWETTRIPKLGFALLLVGITVLTSGLTAIGVRAHERGNVVVLNIASKAEHATPCPLSFEDKNYAECTGSFGTHSGALNYRIKLLSRKGDRIELGVQMKFAQGGNSPGTFKAMMDGPEKKLWFEPGKTLQIDAEGLGPVAVTGEWFDHMPYFARMDVEHNLEPGPNELRMISPILLRGDRVLFDANGGSASAGQPKPAFWVYVPGDGIYILSLSSMPGSVQGHAEDNRVSFEIAGQTYKFVTGAPITREEQVWILHSPNAKSPGGIFGSGSLDGILQLLQIKK
ncbi:MAG TPA: hypothetical protein VFE38_09165 [Edaphobacter sp.]|nr:hypothetical protein [Edaphobacter sp.]